MRILLAVCLAMFGGAGVAKCAVAQSSALAKKLSSPCPVEFVDTHLENAAARLAEKIGANVVLNRRALENFGVDSDTPVTLTLRHASAADVLDVMLRQLELTWCELDDVVFITTPEYCETHCSVKVYRVDDLATPGLGGAANETKDLDALVELITVVVSPDTWDDVGGPGSIQVVEDALVVSQSDPVLREVDNLLTMMRKRASVMNAELSQKLEAPAAFNFDRVSLADFAAAVAEQGKVDVVVDSLALEDEGFNKSLKISAQVERKPLSEALDEALRPYELAWTYRQGVVNITTEHSATEQDLITQVYDVQPIVSADAAPGKIQLDYGPLVELITEFVAPSSWDISGGPATLMPFDGRLVVVQTRRGHQAVSTLLKKIQSADPLAVDQAPSVIDKALASRSDFQFQEASMTEVVKFIQTSQKIPVHLDQKALQEFGVVVAGSPITCSYRDMRLDTFLDIVMTNLDLGWLVEENALHITNSDQVGSRRMLKIYPVSDFDERAAKRLPAAITSAVAPSQWSYMGGEGQISVIGEMMIVLNSYPVHRKVAALLASLRQIRREKPVRQETAVSE